MQPIAKVKNWLFPSCPWIVLLGLDGSGKSSVIEALDDWLAGAGYKGLFVMHRRPQVVYRLAAASSAGQIEHYQKPPHSPGRSAVKLAAMWLDWLSGYVLHIHGRRVRGVLVVADRHSLIDLLVDPLRYRYGGSARWVRLVVRLVPMPNAVILLDAPTAVLQTRKQELTTEKAAELRHNYLNLVQQWPGSYVIDVDRPLDEVVADVQSILQELRAGR